MGNDRQDDPARWPDGVETYPAKLQSYATTRQQLARFQAPQLGGPNGRVFVACFDGTWNDKDQDAVDTNVANIYDQVLQADNKNVKAGYQSGVGTQDNEAIKVLDGGLGFSYGPRMEQMYYDFCVQARNWRIENPNAEISLAATGFSRGAVTAALFTRMVHERGIQNPEGMVIDRDRDGNIQSLTPTKPNLVPPGKTPQVVGLFDPVATGEMNMVDTRLPPSVVSGFQITALDERRDQFLAKQIIDPGLSADGRFLAVQVPGAHSDVGGGYLLNGLSLRNGNLMMAYLNSTLAAPALRERPVPTAPEMNVIHNSEQGLPLWTDRIYAMKGERHVTERLAEPARTPLGMVYDRLTKNMYDAEPVDRALQSGLRYRPVVVGPEREDPSLPAFFKDRPRLLDAPPIRSAPLPGVGAPLEADPALRAPPSSAYGDMLRGVQARYQDDIVTLEAVQVTAPKQGLRSPGGGKRRQNEDAEQQDTPALKQNQAQTFPTDHKDYALFLTIQQQLPKGTPDEKTAELMQAARVGGMMRADQFEKVGFNNDGAYVLGKTWGSHTGIISLSSPAPTLETTLQQSQQVDEQRAQELAQFRAQQETLAQSASGPVMRMGMSSPAT